MADDAIRTATADDLDEVVDALTTSFQDDPLMTWVWPDAALRPIRLRGLWTFMAGDGYVPRGASTVIPGGDGAALWTAPGQDLDDTFWAANARRFMELVDGDADRLSAVSEPMAEHHPHDPHWYLMAIGIAPVAQGRRLGSALLAHTLALADAGGVGSYLEATSPRSRALYERHGFVVTGEITLPDDGPPLWPMWREPA